jgi:hypothetical protein
MINVLGPPMRGTHPLHASGPSDRDGLGTPFYVCWLAGASVNGSAAALGFVLRPRRAGDLLTN